MAPVFDVNFWQAFWPALFSGAVIALLIGFGVGIALWKFQSASDEKKLSESSLREMSALKNKLRTASAIKDIFVIGKPSACLPPSAKQLDKLLSNAPVSLWEERLKHEKKRLEKIKAYQAARDDWASAAFSYDQVLSTAVRVYNHERQIDSVNDQIRMSYFMASFHGLTQDVVFKWLDIRPQSSQPFDDLYKELESNSDLKKSAEKFEKSRTKLVKAASNIVKD